MMDIGQLIVTKNFAYQSPRAPTRSLGGFVQALDNEIKSPIPLPARIHAGKVAFIPNKASLDAYEVN
jgi:hypothetical protein